MRRLYGFTILELLVAATIIGILVSMSVIYTAQTRTKARDATRKQTVTELSTALEQFYATNKTYFVTYKSGGCGITGLGGDGFMTGDSSAGCVGYNGGGEGRVNARSTAATVGSNPNYYRSNSITDALVSTGYLVRVTLDPLTTDYNSVITGRDFLLLLCDATSAPAASPPSAIEYGLFANLELPSTGDSSTAQHHCGGSSTPHAGFNLQYAYGVGNAHTALSLR